MTTLGIVGAVTTPQLVDVVDTISGVRTYSSGGSRTLSSCNVERWGLRIEHPTPEDPFSDAEVTWLMPELGVRLTTYRARSRHAMESGSPPGRNRGHRSRHSHRTRDRRWKNRSLPARRK